VSKAKRQRDSSPETPSPTPVGRALMWFVVLTCAVVIGVLVWYARGILAEIRLAGNNADASTRLLIALFTVMTFGGFVGAAFWAALRKALGRDTKKD
jgi:hypothetical protein